MSGERRLQVRVLDTRVIAVASEDGVSDWVAYIGAVPGQNHDEEWMEVKMHGSKLPEDVARVLFPRFRDLQYRP